MSIERALQKSLQQLTKRGTPTLSVEVLSVDKTQGTCRVMEEQLEFEVRLASVIDSTKNRFYLFPKIGSQLLIAPIEEDINRYHAIGYSEIESLYLGIEPTEFCIDEKGFLLKKEDETLAKLMTDLLQEIQKMKFTTNTGSTIELVNQMEFKKIENRFKNLLKDN